jgi:uncharacterized protein YndB with AHSA1/START domain
MTVTKSSSDRDALTLTFVTEFDAPVGRVWRLWADARALEKWWGPPTWPASFLEYDFREGGGAHYAMTGPEGDEAHGVWRISTIRDHERIEFEDGFASPSGEFDPSLGVTRAEVTFAEDGGRTTMTIVSRFESADQFDQLAEMGMEEGMRSALEQMDSLLSV